MFKRLFLVIIMIFVSGCSIIQHKDALLTLKRLGDDQARQEQFLIRQEKKFQLLLSDIESKKIKIGTSRSRVLSRYGEPIAFKEIENDPVISEQIVYRHPEEFFGSEKVYLFFGKDKKLTDWLYEPPSDSSKD